MNCCQNGIVYGHSDDGATMTLCNCIAGQRLRYPMVPDEMIHWTFDNYPGDAGVRDMVREWCGGRKWLVLAGKPGVGKTSLAVGAYKADCDRRIAILDDIAWIMGRCWVRGGGGQLEVVSIAHPQFWAMEKMLEQSKKRIDESKSDEGVTTKDPLPAVRESVPFLVLDDLGNEKGSPYDVNVVRQILGRRYERWQSMRTVITTNKSLPQLSAYLGDWMTDRLQQVALVIPFAETHSMRRAA
jgi:hypothetical protein